MLKPEMTSRWVFGLTLFSHSLSLSLSLFLSLSLLHSLLLLDLSIRRASTNISRQYLYKRWYDKL